ncbi:hypothetical protein K474DRAFT_801423 [Panus rudis PR-1116 ss-1]|nr:hypothetical protein K474DRAFT_801423 [Panus rudis PR-1116 ss-1]
MEDLSPSRGQFSFQPHENAIGGPNSYQTGFFAGRTIRGELKEVQKADLARKYGLKDRRPLDPPPCVQMRLFEIFHLGTSEQSEKEFEDYTAASLGMMCQADLFPVTDTGSAAMPEPSAEELFTPQIFVEDVDQMTDRDSPVPAPSAMATFSPGPVPVAISQEAFTSNPFRTLSNTTFFGFAPSNTDIKMPFSSLSPLGSDRFSFVPDRDAGMAGPSSMPQQSHTLSLTFNSVPDPATSGDQIAAATSEDSNRTAALYGTLVAHGTPVDHEGRQVVMFVFPDLSVRTVGTYRLRYRAFHIQSGSGVNDSTPVIAECMGGPFTVYSTKGFPGLQPSTDLSKRLSMIGVKVATREQARTRRKLGDT